MALPRDAYTVAWICALPVELEASRHLIDTPHETVRLPAHARQQYVCGNIHGHNVVMACLPAEQPGTSPAAATLSATLENFPNIQFAMMVGIGGGTPKVRLGDVVVGYPDKDFPHGGVIQYDYGKTKDGFKRMGSLNSPGPKVLTALQNVRSTPPNQSSFLKVLGSYKGKFGRPRSGESFVHYGLIASGNQVIKSAKLRDQLSKDANDQILCFEMESGGLVNQISCLVIRGISDLCDEHKNNNWQPYASAAAAAWAKEFLRNISPSEVDRPTTSKVLTAGRRKKAQVPNNSLQISEADESDGVEQMLARLSSYDADIQLKRIARGRSPGTCQWVDETLNNWKPDRARSSVLAIVGKVGSGKTIAMSYAVEKLGGFHHFIRPTDQPHDIFCSLSKQLMGDSVPLSVLSAVKAGFGRRNRKMTVDDVVDKILLPLMLQTNDIVVMLDGIDALEQMQREEVLHHLETVMSNKPLRLLLSRQETMYLKKALAYKEVHVRNAQDIINFIDSKLEELSRPGRILEDEARRSRVRRRLIQGADGMILWVALVLDLLQDSETPAEIDHRLNEIPTTLESAYTCCLQRRDKSGTLLRDVRLLQSVAVAEEHLSTKIWQEILATDDTGEHRPDREPSLFRIRQCGVGLIVIDDEDHTISMVHHSAQRYLFSTAGSQMLSDRHGAELEPATSLQRRHTATMAFAGQMIAHINFYTRGTMVRHINTVVPLVGMMPRIVSKIFSFDTRTSAVISLPPKNPPTTRTELLAYALQKWPTYVKRIKENDSIFSEFRGLALQLDKTENVQPWTESGARTENSLVQGMFAYAVSHNHLPLLRLAMGQDALRREAYSRILVGNELMLPLHLACHMGYLEVAELLSKFCDRDQRCPRTNHTILYLVSEAGREKSVEWLLSTYWTPPSGADKQELYHAFNVALSNKHINVLGLLRPYIWPEHTDHIWPGHADGPLTVAVKLRYPLNTVDLVMSWYAGTLVMGSGIGFMFSNSNEILVQDWRSALTYAIEAEGLEAYVRCLLERRVAFDFITKTPDGHDDISLLLRTQQKGFGSRQVQLMSSHPWILPGGKADIRLLRSAIEDSDIRLLRGLMEKRAVELNSEECPALLIACAARTASIDVINQLLTAQHLNFWLMGKDGRTALSHAATQHLQDTFQRLLARMSDDAVRITDKLGRNALSWAAQAGEDNATDALLKRWPPGALLGDHKGFNALSYAVEQGNVSTVRILLNYTSAISLEQIRGQQHEAYETLHLAIKLANTAIVQLLCQEIITDMFIAKQLRPKAMSWILNARDANLFKVVYASLGLDTNVGMTSNRPLFVALQTCSYDLAMCMLEVPKTDVSIQDEEGRGVYYYALSAHPHDKPFRIEAGFYPEYEALLQALTKRLDASTKDGSGRNAFDWVNHLELSPWIMDTLKDVPFADGPWRL